jgi:phage terminase large subunit
METTNVTFGPSQSRVFTSPKRFIFAMGGKRGGKTTVGCYWSYQESSQMRPQITPAGRTMVPPNGLIAAPTYHQLQQSTLAKFFEEFPMLRKYYKEYKQIIEIPIGKGPDGKTLYSKIYTRSLDEYKNIEGMNLHWAWIDEADSLQYQAWHTVMTRTGTTQGKILCTTTIYPASWINDMVNKRQDPNSIIISWPSIENPAFPIEEWERLKETTDPTVFAREYMSQFVFENGLVYGEILEYGLLDKVPEGVMMLATFIGVDYGLKDDNAIICVGYGSDFNWYILGERVAPSMSVDTVNERIGELMSIHGTPWATFYDPAGGIATLSLRQDCFPIAARKKLTDTPEEAGRITLIKNLIFQRRVYTLKSNLYTNRELGTYSFDQKTGKPEDNNNHTTDAFGYCIYNGFPMVDGLKPKEQKAVLPTLWRVMEEEGYLKDGIFQNKLNSEDELF